MKLNPEHTEMNYMGLCYFKQQKELDYKPTAMEMFADSWEDHVDPKTGELNTTYLVEDVADQLGWHVTNMLSSIPEQMFEWAFEFEKQLVKLGKVQSISL